MSKCVLNFAQTSKSSKLIEEAKKSLRAAILGIFLTLGVGIIGIGIAIYSVIVAKDAGTEKTQKELLVAVNEAKHPSIPHAKLDAKLESIQLSLNGISTNINIMPEKVDALNESIKEVRLELIARPNPIPLIINNCTSGTPASNKQSGLFNNNNSH